MFPLASLRIASRRVLISPAFSRTAVPTSRWVPNALTRSFITSVARAEPTKSKTASKAKKPSPAKAAKKPANKPAKKKPVKAKAVKKKPVKKIVKLTIPRNIKIPSLGPSTFFYYITKVYQKELPNTAENLLANTMAASAAWNALPASEKEKYNAICSEQRAKALEERRAYINKLPRSILQEINRRRVAKGKTKLHKKKEAPEGYVITAYTRWFKAYHQIHPEAFRDRGSMARLGKIWNGLSAEEKQPYIDEYEKEKIIAQNKAGV